jgi:hypothetical protein
MIIYENSTATKVRKISLTPRPAPCCGKKMSSDEKKTTKTVGYRKKGRIFAPAIRRLPAELSEKNKMKRMMNTTPAPARLLTDASGRLLHGRQDELNLNFKNPPPVA